jgi:hypothetical protein
MIGHSRHLPSFVDMFSSAIIAVLLVLTAYGNAEAMIMAALILLVVGIGVLPPKYFLPAIAVAGIGIAIAAALALVLLLP